MGTPQWMTSNPTETGHDRTHEHESLSTLDEGQMEP